MLTQGSTSSDLHKYEICNALEKYHSLRKIVRVLSHKYFCGVINNFLIFVESYSHYRSESSR